MLLKDYTLEIFKSKCQADAKGVHCFAHLNQDVSEALPYLNSVLGGFEYIKNPASVTFKAQGKLITVHGNKIAVNALKDEDEARKIVDWLKREINEAWEKRKEIVPSYEGAPRPKFIEILKLLPNRAGCRACGEPTCMVFATKMAEGGKGTDSCPQLSEAQKNKLDTYMEMFQLDI
jgi:ArsR family metal-binding transcriptional regulator